MINKNITQLSLLILSLFFYHSHLTLAQNPGTKAEAQNCSPVVRIYYLPPDSYFHAPLILESSDQRKDGYEIAPRTPEGRKLFITPSEMRRFISNLRTLNLQWGQPVLSGPLAPVTSRDANGTVNFSWFDAGHVRVAHLRPASLCDTMERLDSAFTQKRTLWEFQLFRSGFGCKIPGFNRSEYPDHDSLH
jgi:hypothetical protein